MSIKEAAALKIADGIIKECYPEMRDGKKDIAEDEEYFNIILSKNRPDRKRLTPNSSLVVNSIPKKQRKEIIIIHIDKDTGESKVTIPG